jgi:hypothetical protein
MFSRKATVVSPLSLEDVRKRINEFLAEDKNSHQSGLFANFGWYAGHMTNDKFYIHGPYGYKKWPIRVHGELRADSSGVMIDFKVRLGGEAFLTAMATLAVMVGCVLAVFVDAQLAVAIVGPLLLLFIFMYVGIVLLTQSELIAFKKLLTNIVSK